MIAGHDRDELEPKARVFGLEHFEAEALKVRSRSARVHCRSTVEGKLACEAQINFMLTDA